MSDGDNATPGPPRLPGPPDAGGDNQWLTRTPRPSPGAAPWERNGTSESGYVEHGPADRQQPHRRCDGCRPDRQAARRFECSRWTEAHHAANPIRRRRRQADAADPPHRGHRGSRPAPDGRGPRQRGHRSDPHRARCRPRTYPTSLDLRRAQRVPPSHVGDREGTQATRSQHKRRTTMVAGRAAAALIAVLALAMTGGGVAMAVVQEPHAQHGLRT